jgi:hypothetical protein
MALARGEVNPLSVLGMRRLSFIPEHFSSIKVPTSVDIRLLDQWISYNLNSRYSIKKSVTLDSINKLSEVIEIGMEDPMELTLFSLGCPYIHKT